MTRKPRAKVYIDTSLIVALSYVEEEFHRESVTFLGRLKGLDIATSIGPSFLLEVAKAAELRGSEAASRLVGTVEGYDVQLTRDLGDLLWNLADEYVSRKVLGAGDMIDLMHFASATLTGCAHLASWDVGHFNDKIATKVNSVNSSAGWANLIAGDPITIQRYLEHG